MNKEQAKEEAIVLAKSKWRNIAIVCLVDGGWIPAAHHEARYLTSFSPMHDAEEIEVCDIHEEPRVWKFEPIGQGAYLKDILDALPRKGE